MDKVTSDPYAVYVGSDIVHHFIKQQDNAILLVDDKLTNRYKPSINENSFLYDLKSAEENKTFENLQKILERSIQHGITRNSCIITIGGGMIGDLGGLAASLLLRGIKWINIPTTLLAQVDSCIGGKTAINSAYGKNLIGTFYNPHVVLVDVSTLDTLPQIDFISGISEVIKYSLLDAQPFFNWLGEHSSAILNRERYALEFIIKKSILTKLSIVQSDPLEKHNKRIILNLGHTIGHAIEYASNYKINHGIAVAIGIAGIYKLAANLNYITNNMRSSVLELLLMFNLPTSISIDEINIEAFSKALNKDKKRGSNEIIMIIPKDIGSVEPITFDPKFIEPIILQNILE